MPPAYCPPLLALAASHIESTFHDVPLDRRLQWTRQIALAVHYLHREEFVHRACGVLLCGLFCLLCAVAAVAVFMRAVVPPLQRGMAMGVRDCVRVGVVPDTGHGMMVLPRCH
jgi:hypothetical protein